MSFGVAVAATVLAVVPAPEFTLKQDATLTLDQGRMSARIYHVDLYTPEGQPMMGTLAFKETLAANAGGNLRVCVRSHASKRGSVSVFIPRSTVDILHIPTPKGGHYKTRCVEFTVRAAATSRPGFVQVANDGPNGRVDLIRNVSLREVR